MDGHGGANGAAFSGVYIGHDADGAPLGSGTAAQGTDQTLGVWVNGVCIDDSRVQVVFNCNQMLSFLLLAGPGLFKCVCTCNIIDIQHGKHLLSEFGWSIAHEVDKRCPFGKMS